MPADDAGRVLAENTLPQMINEFTFDMQRLLSDDEDGNAVFSPYSIFEALAMVNVGARNNTKKEIEAVLKLGREENLPSLLRNIRDDILGEKGSSMFIANKIWIADHTMPLPAFNENLNEYFNAEIGTEAFATNWGLARQNINKWVSDKTCEKIKDLFSPDSITSRTRFVLANAIYFKGLWDTPFDKNRTHPGKYFLSDGSSIEGVQFMFANGSFKTCIDRNVLLLELPYEGDSFSMILAMPEDPDQVRYMRIAPPRERYPDKDESGDKIKNIAELKVSINKDLFKKWLEKLSSEFLRDMDLYLPRFEIEHGIDLLSRLKELGVRDLFDASNADLSAITGHANLYCSTAVHKAFLKVDETGTTAAAATGFADVCDCMPPIPREIRVDRPFLFFLIHKPSESIIFSGNVFNPLL